MLDVYLGLKSGIQALGMISDALDVSLSMMRDNKLPIESTLSWEQSRDKGKRRELGETRRLEINL